MLARRATHAEGAGESGLSRLLELHAFNAAGDAAVAVALAGTLFFQVPTGEARGQVALFLLLTMLPFAIVAPLIGPFLDRFRRGRRWAIGYTMALRAFLCWVLATSVTTESVAQFPAALGVLVASKAYGVTRASAVPRLIPHGLTLVKTNSRVSLAGVAGAALSAPLAGGLAWLGPQWTLRYAFLVFVGGTILAILLPSRVDSAVGEDAVAMNEMGGGARRSRRLGITPVVVTGLRANAGLRGLSGFLTMYMAFLLRDRPFAGWEDRTALLLGLVVGAAGLGSTLGTVLGNWLRAHRPEVIVVVVLVADAAMAVTAALLYSLPVAVALGLTVGLCQQLGKLSLDALIQDDVPEKVRTSVFARSETLLQLSWVLGGGLGIALPLQPRLGLGIVAALLLGWVVVVLRGRAAVKRRQARFALTAAAPTGDTPVTGRPPGR
ncbi:MAG: MFS transporter [Actinomycetota bacterium]|nr:MFS transporter [Actinomycetota bacterium]